MINLSFFFWIASQARNDDVLVFHVIARNEAIQNVLYVIYFSCLNICFFV